MISLDISSFYIFSYLCNSFIMLYNQFNCFFFFKSNYDMNVGWWIISYIFCFMFFKFHIIFKMICYTKVSAFCNLSTFYMIFWNKIRLFDIIVYFSFFFCFVCLQVCFVFVFFPNKNTYTLKNYLSDLKMGFNTLITRWWKFYQFKLLWIGYTPPPSPMEVYY